MEYVEFVSVVRHSLRDAEWIDPLRSRFLALGSTGEVCHTPERFSRGWDRTCDCIGHTYVPIICDVSEDRGYSKSLIPGNAVAWALERKGRRAVPVRDFPSTSGCPSGKECGVRPLQVSQGACCESCLPHARNLHRPAVHVAWSC